MPFLEGHWGFVIASYAISTIVLGGLILSVVMDRKRQRRLLSDLEAAGVGRRGRRRRTDEI